jgi:hypothetical protein
VLLEVPVSGFARPRTLPLASASLSLSNAVTLLAEAVHQEDTGSAVFGISQRSDGPVLLLRPLEGLHPVTALLEWRAPRRWSALGVIAQGTARNLDRSNPRRVALVTGLSRAGQSATVVVGPDGPLHTGGAQQGPDSSAFSGRIADALARALALPTAPPERRVGELWAAMWLERVLDAWEHTRTPTLSWDAVVGMHPFAILNSIGPSDLPDAPQAACSTLSQHPFNQLSWEDLRRVTARGDAGLLGVSPALARWLDEGSYSRWVLDDLPPLEVLLDTADARLPRALRRPIRQVASLADLVPPPPPRR